ncbi:hypothetical protein SETIT_7G017800v2 [Setaria italica]|uniref:RNase H type-1 domain-containing protein n=1 Tax=Setaria italica TaxID=4555 RepID=K3YD76_SETIT|nr:hypothetical protein SETIT_7G017800v2 [Setaria italica]
MFVWHVAHNALQVKLNIAGREVSLDTLCPMRSRFDEHSGHLFFKCKEAKLGWQLLNMEDKRVMLMAENSPKAIPKWRAPPEDVYKINCDGSSIPGSNKAGWGFIVRDHYGNIIAAGAGLANLLLSAQPAEAVACMKGLEHAAELGMRRVILEASTDRYCNVIDDTLAAMALNCINSPLLWQDRLPDSVASLVSGDLPGAHV